ncbi:alpha/beta fold hydrolase [Paenibacillus sp. NRS-1760]|uniref:alpha/beta fold hydrolase n=1 Tax=Paenibacillus sp. NRS-1760 TaxID=3233902 RepID=UPI003D2D9B26
MRFITANGINMGYRIYNTNKASRTIVLVHGLGLDMDLWNPLINYIEKDYKVVSFNLRGHGNSDRGDAKLCWDLFIDDIYELVNTLGITSFDMVGHGFGATLAMKFSHIHQKLVSTLILIAVPAIYPQKSYNALFESRKQLVAATSMLPLAQRMATGITKSPVESDVFQKIVAAYNCVTPETYFDILYLYKDSTPALDFESLVHPTLALIGELDPLYLTSYTLSARLFIKTRLLIVPNSSNAVFIDQAQLTGIWIHDFIVNAPNANKAFEIESSQHVISYFQEVFEEGMKKLEPTETIQVDLLSSFQVIINGEEKRYGWNQRYAKSLLVFLLFNRTTTREQLCDALFPEVPLPKALKNLKVYLNHLRKITETNFQSGSILMSDKNHITLRGSVKSDVLTLKDLLHKAHLENDPQSKLKMCKELLFDLPEQLMPGIYDDWFITYRSAMEEQIVLLAKDAAVIEEQNNKLQESRYFLYKALIYHPEDEWLCDQSNRLSEKMKAKMLHRI